MSEVFRLQGTIDVNTRQATTSLQQVSSQGQQAENRFATVGSGLQSVGKTMTVVGAGITAGMAKIIGTSKEWDATVAQQEFLYKNLDGSIQKFISTGAKQAETLGMTTQQYENNATALSNALNLLGMSNEDISKNGEAWMSLAADMGAFADVPIDVAIGDMKSALVGNFEALDKYGMNISVATINNSEYAKSIGKTWDKMSQAEKTQAIMNETMNQAKNYTGLAGQEADQFGMKWNLAKQKMMESAAAIGNKLLPVLAPLVEKIGNIAQKIADWANEHPKLTQTILLIVGVIGVLMVTLGPLLLFIGTLMVVIPGIIALGAPVIGAIAGVIAGVIALVTAGIALISNWGAIKAKCSEVWNAIKSSVSNTINTLKSTITNVWNGIKTATSNVWNSVKSTITNSINNARDTVKSVIDKIKGFFKFTISWPHIPIPKFSITPPGWKLGDLLKGSIPRLNIGWHAKGGIMNDPTMFGLSGNTAHIGGEAGPEAILPLNPFYDTLDKKLNSINRETIDYDKMTECFIKALTKVDNSIYMDGNLVGIQSASAVKQKNEKTEIKNMRLRGELDYV